MRGIAWIAAACVVGLLAAGVARAELCEKCRGKAYTADVGRCQECGRDTASGAFRLCQVCSAKLGRCECCGERLDGAASRPADEGAGEAASRPAKIDLETPGTYEAEPWKFELSIRGEGERKYWFGELSYEGLFQTPVLGNEQVNDYMLTPWGKMYWVGVWSGQEGGRHGWLPEPNYGRKLLDRPLGPIGKAAYRRLWQLKQHLDFFWLRLEYCGPQDKPFYGLTLQMLKPAAEQPATAAAVQVTREGALRLLSEVAHGGSLARAADASEARPKRPAGPAYVLTYGTTVRGRAVSYFEDLGWGPEMLERLDALRKATEDGAPARGMDLLLGRLAGLRDAWAASRPAATQPDGP